MVFLPPKTNPMPEENTEDLDSLTQDELTDSKTVEGEQDAIPDAELKKAQDYAKNQKIRAEKAEAELKKLKVQPKVEVAPKNDMSLKDIRALSDVHDDDVDDLTDYAKYKNITVAEAKKTPAMQSLLKAKAEERKSAEAANTQKPARGTSTVSDDTLLERAATEGLPEKDEDIERLVEARLNQRIKIVKKE